MSTPVEKINILRAGFSSGKTLAVAWRLKQLEQLDHCLRKHEGELLAALHEDLGKHATEGWVTELGYLHKDIAYTMKHLRRWMRPQRVSQPLLTWPGRSEIRPEPLGVVLILGAWNYPVQLLLSPLVAALAAGNTALLKPSELAPATASLIAKLLPQYLAQDAVQVCTGGADVASELLAERFDHIFYTGGERVGKIVMRAAAEYLTPVTLELGGKSPALVSRNTNLTTAAKRIAWGKWVNAGQTCIAPDYVLVEDSVYEPLLEALTSAIQDLYGQQPLTHASYGKIVNQQHFERLTQALDTSVSEGAKIICGGERDAESLRLAPTVVSDVAEQSALLQTEIFGPILPVLKVSDMSQAERYVQGREKPLALYGFTDDADELERWRAIPAGNQCFNDTLMFMLNPELPFGGVGTSGMGRYHGKFGFLTFSHQKAIMHRRMRPDPSFRYPPYNGWKTRLLRWLSGG